MKKLLLTSVLLGATTTLFAVGSSGMTGKWHVHNSISGSESDQVCTFSQNGKKLTGSCKGDNGVVKLTGTVEGKNIAWKYDSDYQGTPLTLNYTGTFADSGDIQGQVEVDPFGVSGDFKATPLKAEGGAQ